MSGKRMTLFSVIAAFLIAVAVFLGFHFLGGGETATVTLPEVAESGGPDAQFPEGDGSGLRSVEILPETVQAVIRTLERPTSYHRLVETQLLSADGSLQSTAELWQRGSLIRLDVSENGQTKHYILTEDTLYVWYNEERQVFTSSLPDSEELYQLADAFSAVPGYETLLHLDKKQILDAGYTQLDGQNCIYVRARSNALNYIEEYYIDNTTGLLLEASTYDGGRLVHTMRAGAADLTAPEDALFCLPGEDQALTS